MKQMLILGTLLATLTTSLLAGACGVCLWTRPDLMGRLLIEPLESRYQRASTTRIPCRREEQHHSHRCCPMPAAGVAVLSPALHEWLGLAVYKPLGRTA
jgi:hypothetical protein